MSFLNKLVAVFGVNAALGAEYSKTEVVYKDGSAKLAFPLTAEGVEAKEPGIYTVEIKAKEPAPGAVEAALEYELIETFVEGPKAATKPPKAAPVARQSPAYGYGEKQRF